MILARALAAELRKLLTLPGVWAGIGVTVLGTAVITALNAFSERAAFEAGEPAPSVFKTAYAAMPLGTVGAVVIGVLAIGAEYTANSPDAGGGRQIGTTLTAVPRRLALVAAKAVAVVLLTAATAAVAVPLSITVAQLLGGAATIETVPSEDAVAWWLGAVLYWTLMALIAFGATVLTRNVIVPLVVLTANSTLVSFSLLLTKLTPLAYGLPDMAGRKLFGGVDMVDGGLDAGPGGVVMAAWAAALVTAGGIVFTRRDA
ncbi:hypothetical protein ACWCXX_34175 [Streptomyces sp. NPDC001732]